MTDPDSPSSFGAAALSRRGFVRGSLVTGVAAAANRLTSDFLAFSGTPDGGQSPAPVSSFLDGFDFPEIGPGKQDTLTLPEGFVSEVLLKRGAVLGGEQVIYGDDNDYLAYLPDGPDSGWLWINHETSNTPALEKGLTDEKVITQLLRDVGGSCLRLRRDAKSGRWRPEVPSPENFRVDGLSSILPLTGPAAGHALMGGVKEVKGTLANCGGGLSPWGTFFSGEENFYLFFGDPDFKEEPGIKVQAMQRPVNHYGWMVEIDPVERTAVKHTALGRFAHENIAFAITKDGRLAAYMGDDRAGQCLYKYISTGRYDAARGKTNRELLLDGTLHAADVKAGKWIPLDPEKTPALKEAGYDKARICIETRKAAKIAGASALDRPEDVEVHPDTGEVFVCLTSYAHWPGASKSAPAGAILSLKEKDNDHGSLEFTSRILVHGREDTGLVWPDNLSFTPGRSLLVTTDFKFLEKPDDESCTERIGNNQLFVVPTSGPNRGKVRRFAVAPRGAEFCSPTLSPDGSELWVNVQHPGENTNSTWPDGTGAPRSSLVAIRRREA